MINRRVFLCNGSLFLAASAATSYAGSQPKRSLRLGIVTDLHYADKPPAGSRHYRKTLRKLDEAALKFEGTKPDAIVELGDFIDAADSVAAERKYLATVNAKFSEICQNRHYVLGNHCVATLTKEEFLGDIQRSKSYYSFDIEDYHFVVLVACFRSDGKPYQRNNFKWTDSNIPPSELEWLRSDLAGTEKKVVVLAHQRIDVTGNHGIKNNAEVREILEAADNVLAVIQGHSHGNDLKQINGINYCTLVAMVEGARDDDNGYTLTDLYTDGSIKIEGFRKQHDYSWSSPA